MKIIKLLELVKSAEKKVDCLKEVVRTYDGLPYILEKYMHDLTIARLALLRLRKSLINELSKEIETQKNKLFYEK